jgi:hypothetical protein
MCGSESLALDRSETRKTKAAEMSFLRLIPGYTLTDHVHNMTIHNALQIYASEESIQDYKNI